MLPWLNIAWFEIKSAWPSFFKLKVGENKKYTTYKSSSEEVEREPEDALRVGRFYKSLFVIPYTIIRIKSNVRYFFYLFRFQMFQNSLVNLSGLVGKHFFEILTQSGKWMESINTARVFPNYKTFDKTTNIGLKRALHLRLSFCSFAICFAICRLSHTRM